MILAAVAVVSVAFALGFARGRSSIPESQVNRLSFNHGAQSAIRELQDALAYMRRSGSGFPCTAENMDVVARQIGENLQQR